MNHTDCSAETCLIKDETIPSVRPQFRTRQDDSGATIEIALPGVKKEDVKLTLHESQLKIEGLRGDSPPAEWKTHRQTTPSGRYELGIQLTSKLDGTRTVAGFTDGVLTLQVPVREGALPRQIAVN